jgi:hypothetical protein
MNTKTALTCYDFIDHPLSALENRDAAFVVAMRIWAKAAMSRVCPLRLVAPRFVLSGQTRALMPFHSFMTTLGRTAARAVGLCATEEGCVTDDEALILTALAAVDQRNTQGVQLAFASLAHADGLNALSHKAMLLERF